MPTILDLQADRLKEVMDSIGAMRGGRYSMLVQHSFAAAAIDKHADHQHPTSKVIKAVMAAMLSDLFISNGFDQHEPTLRAQVGSDVLTLMRMLDQA